MGFVVDVNGVITEHALVALVALGVLVILNFAAAVKIIHQAGYTRWWSIVPLIPLALTIANFVTLWNRTHSFALGGAYGFVGLNEATIGIIFRLDEVALGVSWATFLVFAFLRWPVSGEHDEVVESAHRRTFRRRAEAALAESVVVANTGGAGAAVGRPMKVPREARAARKSEAAPAGDPPPRRGTSALKHCVWCGDPLPGSRALFHDCGDKDAPPVFCARCGTALSEDSESCLQCA